MSVLYDNDRCLVAKILPGPLNLLIPSHGLQASHCRAADSTDLKSEGEGGWNARKHSCRDIAAQSPAGQWTVPMTRASATIPLLTEALPPSYRREKMPNRRSPQPRGPSPGTKRSTRRNTSVAQSGDPSRDHASHGPAGQWTRSLASSAAAHTTSVRSWHTLGPFVPSSRRCCTPPSSQRAGRQLPKCSSDQVVQPEQIRQRIHKTRSIG